MEKPQKSLFMEERGEIGPKNRFFALPLLKKGKGGKNTGKSKDDINCALVEFIFALTGISPENMGIFHRFIFNWCLTFQNRTRARFWFVILLVKKDVQVRITRYASHWHYIGFARCKAFVPA